MDKIPMEWVDKIFDIMSDWFGEKWANNFKDPRMLGLLKTSWQSGLTGLTKEEIREGLKVAKQQAKKGMYPPLVLDFYRYCKGYPEISQDFPTQNEVNSDIPILRSQYNTKMHINNIRRVISAGGKNAFRNSNATN